jgi:SAM-dependent methyltransferase
MNDYVESIQDFYNAVASEYNGHMTNSDRKVRGTVKYIFTNYVKAGNVLDFGGGTGLDIPWLVENNYNVIFLEPSENMRLEARRSIVSNSNVTFIEKNTNFNNWSEVNLPFDQKVDGIISNFAVLNCIENIDGLFEKLSLISNRNCRFLATIIDPRLLNMSRNYSLLSAIKMFFGSKITVYNKYRNEYHPTYIHSLKALARSANSYFKLELVVPLVSSCFVGVIFKRK